MMVGSRANGGLAAHIYAREVSPAANNRIGIELQP